MLDRLGPGARREAWLDAEQHEEVKMTRSVPRTRSAHDRPGTLAAEPDLNYLPDSGPGVLTRTDTTATPETIARRLTGRVAVVTGATSGIGGREERRRDLAAELEESVAAGVLAVPADVTEPDALGRAARSIRDELRRVDLVVADAGATPVPTARRRTLAARP